MNKKVKYIGALLFIFTTFFLLLAVLMYNPNENKIMIDEGGNTEIQNPNAEGLIYNETELIDHTYLLSDELCLGGNLGMNISIKPCIASTFAGEDINQEVSFSWNGLSSQQISWIFVYEGTLDSGSMLLGTLKNITINKFKYMETYVNNYPINNVIDFVDISPPNGQDCDLGNENNTFMYEVTQNGANGTVITNYCFSEVSQVNSSSYLLSGNASILKNMPVIKQYIDYDVEVPVQYLGNNLLGNGFSFYNVQDVLFLPGQTYYTKWIYNPAENELEGKWYIFGFNSALQLTQAIDLGQYIYLDPGWNSNLNNSIVAYYNFNETSGDLIDIVDGDDSGSVGSGIQRPFDGISENAYNITISTPESQAINITGANDLNFTSNFTINVWVNTTSQDAVKIISKRTSGVDYQIQRDTTLNSTNLNIRQTDDSAISVTTSDNTHLANSEWLMITAVANGTDLVLYLDGVESASVGYDGTIRSLANRFFIGEDARNTDILPWGGLIDEAGFWNRFLSQSEIIQLYNSGSGITYNPDFSGLTIILNFPDDGSQLSNSTVDFNSTITPFGGQTPNITNATLYIWKNSVLFLNETNSTLGQSTGTDVIFTENLEIGNFKWNVLACINVSSGCSFAPSNYSFSIQAISVNQTFNAETFDTDNQTFLLELSFDPDIIAELYGTFVYDENIYPTTSVKSGTNVNFSITFDIPAVFSIKNNSFFWTINSVNISGGSNSFNTSLSNQTVFPSSIDQCGSNPFTAVNYTVFREDTRAHLTSPLQINFEWYLGGGSVVKNASFDDATEINHLFCINAQNDTFYTTARMDSNNDGFEDQQFDFLLERYTNATTHQLMGVENDTAASNIIIKVKDSGAQPLSGWMVQIYKFYPELGESLLVGSRITDTFGQFEESLIERDVRYRFDFYDDRRRLRQTEDGIVACELTFCFIEFIIEDILDIFDIFGDIEGYERSLTFSNSSSSFVFSWSDSTGEIPTHRLLVQRLALNQTLTICNATSTSVVGSLSCFVGNSTATYSAQGFRKTGSDEIRVSLLTIKIGDISITFGLEGFFWSFMLLMTLLGVGSWNPSVGIGLYIIGFALLGGFGLFYMPPALFFSGLIVGVLFIWALKS